MSIAIIRQAIAEQQKGATSVILWPIFDCLAPMWEAGAEGRPLGPVQFRELSSQMTPPHPANVACSSCVGNGETPLTHLGSRMREKNAACPLAVQPPAIRCTA
jgi:hypothetical protein